MAKTKKLGKDFQEIIDSRDYEAFEKYFDKYEISATDAGKTTCNAFSYRNLTKRHIQFLADHGLDVNADCGYGYTSVAFQAYNKENLQCLLDNGADIDHVINRVNGTALSRTCTMLNPEAVRNLLDADASVHVPGDISGKSLLDSALSHCDNIFIPKVLEISRMLLDAGLMKSDKTDEYVTKIGERFEFFRDSIVPEMVDEISAALDELYKLFEVPPVPRRSMHDGMEQIIVKGKTWTDQYNELWQSLVPGNGKAKTVQGEMIRIAGRVTYEILDNGGINWDEDYQSMLQEVLRFMNTYEPKNLQVIDEITGIINKINPDSDKAALYRMTELIVGWVVTHSIPIALGGVLYMR